MRKMSRHLNIVENMMVYFFMLYACKIPEYFCNFFMQLCARYVLQRVESFNWTLKAFLSSLSALVSELEH